MPDTASILHQTTLTEAINEQKSPNSFVRNRFFPRNRTVPTRHIELSYIRRGRKIAPFVERNGAGIMVEGRNESFVTVMPPHIRIKRPMTPSDLLNKRRPGNVIHTTAQDIARAAKEYIADEQEMLLDDLTNTEEWLACMALRGQISYVAQDESAFTITMPRSASNTIILTGADLWSATTSSPRVNFMQAAEVVNEGVSLNVTDVILGRNAADEFLAHAELESKLDILRLRTGTVDLTSTFQDDGAILLGEYTQGIKIWRYNRTVEVDGVAVDLIRPDYAEFIARTPAAQWLFYFGAIEDMKAIGSGNVLQSQRFSKSWEEEDPSARMLLMESNPLPCMRRPDASLSMRVT
jgi:hypothetical protein